MTGAGCWRTWPARSPMVREVISDFRVMADQRRAVRPGRLGADLLAGAERDRGRGPAGRRARIAAAVNAARRVAWAGAEARHGAIPGIAVADKTLEGVICLRLDATVVACALGQARRRAQFQGLWPAPAWAAGATTPASRWPRCCARAALGPIPPTDHLTVLGEAIAALPPKFRRRLMVTCDGAGASHDLIDLPGHACRPAGVIRSSTPSAGSWASGRSDAITAVPGAGLADRRRSPGRGPRAPRRRRLR